MGKDVCLSRTGQEVPFSMISDSAVFKRSVALSAWAKVTLSPRVDLSYCRDAPAAELYRGYASQMLACQRVCTPL